MRFITKTSEYQGIYRDHSKVQGDYFSVLYQIDPALEESAVGIVIRGKVGKAVIRNKLKRRIRAYLNQNSPKIAPTVSAVIIARDNAAEAGWNEINQDLDRCFNKIGQASEVADHLDR
jgi:ribonuclease P protein component